MWSIRGDKESEQLQGDSQKTVSVEAAALLTSMATPTLFLADPN